MILILPSQSLVLNAYAVLVGSTPGNAAFKEHQLFINTAGVGEAGYKAALNSMVESVSTASLASTMLTNLGLGSFFTQADAEAFLTANASNRAGAMMDLAKALYNLAPTDPIGLAAVTAYRAKVDGSYTFSNNIANVNGQALDNTVGDGQTFTLTAGMDNLIGSAFADNFVARTINNGNTLQDGDSIDGGAGLDTLYVDFTNLGNAITPVLKNIEAVVIRAQTTTTDNTNGNNTSSNNFINLVQVDAQRSLAVDLDNHVTADFGVTRWESNNSRSDVVIEDVRIGNAQKTSDVTIAMVETDPGNVDFAVYFDQQSLRNTGSGTTTLTIQLMDTGAAAGYNGADKTKPLLNNPYDTFKFLVNDIQVEVALNPAGNTTAAAEADTYEQLLALFQAALANSGVTASLGSPFTITDPLTNTSVTGQSIVLTANGTAKIGTNALSGWYNLLQSPVPADANIYNKFSNAETTTTELVTSKVWLDDVGRSNMGGDLVIGGMSTGDTSNYTIYRGVERFEITVGDNSKLQTINSTNNALREVTIVSGATSRSTKDAYTTTVLNEGDLTVNGDANNIPGGGVNNITGGASGGNNNLPGVENNSPLGIHHGAGAAGFTDVRLIDASAFKGKLAFTAAITGDVINKYITAVDTAANPGADVAGSGNVNFNVKGANFIYDGGNDNDTMVVTIDAAVASSRSSVVAGKSDFTFKFSGNAGNDTITTTIINPALAGGAQAWYTNQQLNANISIFGGDGNDIIRTPGAGDIKIDAGTGDDVVYTDNTGSLVIPVANGGASAAATAYTNAAAAELAAGLAANVASNATGFVRVSGTEAGGSAFVSTAARAAALNVLNLVTPVTYDVATAPTYAALQVAINAAVAAGGLTFEEAIALANAYKTETTTGVVTPAGTLIDQVLTHGTANVGGVISSADFAAGNTKLDEYIANAKAAAAIASSADTLVADGAPYNATVAAPGAGELLNGTQQKLIAATQAVNNVFDPVGVGSGITVTISNYVEGVTPVVAVAESQLVTLVGNSSGAVSFLGSAVAGSVAADTAAQTATKIAADSAAIIAAWNAIPANAAQQIATITQANAADAFVTVTFTAPMGNVASLAASATSAGIVFGAGAEVVQGSLGVAGVTESYTATITGAAAAGETITVDGFATGAFAGGESTTAIATAINAAINNAAGSFSSVSAANVITVTGTAPNTAIAGTVNAGDFVSSVSNPVAAGTQTTVNNLNALNAALVVGATDAQVVTALQTAIDNGSISAGNAGLLFAAAVATAGTVDATELLNAQAILVPLQTTAANLNTAALKALETARTNDVAAVQVAAGSAAGDPVAGDGNAFAGIPPAVVAQLDNIGSNEAAAAAAAAEAALKAAKAVAVTGLTATTTAAANLEALKAAIIDGTTDLAVVTATTNAVSNGSITAGDKTAIDAAATAVTNVVGTPVTATEKIAVDKLITAIQLVNDVLLADATRDVANLQAIVDATATAKTIAAAAAASGGAGVAEFAGAQKAVFVFNTSDQTSAYDRLTHDERNLADLKSDANNSYNFFNSMVKVTYKGIDASVLVVAGTGAKTTDLEINQAIKNAINTDAVLSKLLLATDGPANTLVVTSLIDGTHALTNLAVTVTLPTSVSAADLATAVTAGVVPAAATIADLQAVMTAAKTAFDAKGDYVTQWAESGAANGNTFLVGANSTSSSDNTVSPGDGKDVIVLGTTVGTDLLTSSNEVVVYAGTNFGDDTIVNFAASGLGIDQLNFSALNGRGSAFGSFVTDKSIVVGAPAATALTATQVAALFTDSATAINHVYVAVDTNNIGHVWQVADAAGTAAAGVVATLVGSIDLADTSWSTLTAANFV